MKRSASCRSTPNMTSAKDVTRQRLFLETLEDVLQKSNKVIIEEGKEGTGVALSALARSCARQNARRAPPPREPSSNGRTSAPSLLVAVIALVG